MRSKLFLLILMYGLVSFAATSANSPGDKRTILTAGEKVFKVYYQLGQSTVIYLGIRPETVICGNKNYFNIEKLKDGITIQPLSNFSTNLTIMSQGRRYLFYLTPAKGVRPDGFIEAKWVPTSQIRSLRPLARLSNTLLKAIGKKTKLTDEIVFTVVNEKSSNSDGRRIFEIELRSDNKKEFDTNEFEVVATSRGFPIDRQVIVWDTDHFQAKAPAVGRLIVIADKRTPLTFAIGYHGRTNKISIDGGKN